MTIIDNPHTTGIGSLPHHNIDAALNFAFQTDIPFLPQIPIRNPWEFMVAQALEGLPGLEVEAGGAVFLDVDVWSGRHQALNERLKTAFESANHLHAFESFEPSQATSSSWQPFLWELEERKTKIAKIQIAGPMTCQWAIQFRNESKHPSGLSTQIYRLVLARALAMTRKIKSVGTDPILFIDEPGLYSLIPSDPLHGLKLQELKLMIQTLKKEAVKVGLHCCSNTTWSSVLGLDLNYLSIDTELSLPSLLENRDLLKLFFNAGGKLSLGIIPTARALDFLSFNPQVFFHRLLEIFGRSWGEEPQQIGYLLRQSLYTPACGLALHPVQEAENILHALADLKNYIQSTVSN